MERMCWKDGWREYEAEFFVLIENGKIMRAAVCNGIVFPYIKTEDGEYEEVSGKFDANMKNFRKIIWR